MHKATLIAMVERIKRANETKAKNLIVPMNEAVDLMAALLVILLQSKDQTPPESTTQESIFADGGTFK